jgi:hypothetical protein
VATQILKALTDSSSAILLYRAGLFSKITTLYELVMTSSVFAELTVTGYPGATAFENAQQRGEVTVVSLREETAHTQPYEDLKALAWGPGERDTIVQYYRGMGDFVLVDDKKAAEYCANRDIPFINALLAARLLHLVKFISVNEYEKAKQKLLTIGRYSDSIISYALHCPRDKLSFFAPTERNGKLLV